jgi:hypothetical protein
LRDFDLAYVGLGSNTTEAVEAARCMSASPQKRPVPHRTSFLGSLVEEMRLAEIEFPLDPAPRLVLQFSALIEIVDLLPLGGNQLKFDLIVKLGELVC